MFVKFVFSATMIIDLCVNALGGGGSNSNANANSFSLQLGER